MPPGTGDAGRPARVRPELLPAGWSVGTAMCPEFLREGCGVDDFFTRRSWCVGTADARVRRPATELFAFLDQEIRHVDVAPPRR